MAGMNVACVMMSQPSALVGNLVYPTLPMPASTFCGITLDVSVAAFIGHGTPAATFTLQESNDGVTYFNCTGTLPTITIASTAILPMSVSMSAVITRAWVRLTVALTGTDPGVTCWANGFFELRER